MGRDGTVLWEDQPLIRPATPAAARGVHVGLDRAQTGAAVTRAPMPEDRRQGLDLDGVAERGPGAVRLDGVRPRGWAGVARAWRITRSWAGPLGRSGRCGPSWLTADPRITARTGSPSATASDSRFNRTTPQPSPRTKPSAASSKALHRPSGAIRRLRQHERVLGRQHHVDTAGQRQVAPLAPRLWQARCTATSEDEQAVSMVPCSGPQPQQVGHPAGGDAGSVARWSPWWSPAVLGTAGPGRSRWRPMPTNTPVRAAQRRSGASRPAPTPPRRPPAAGAAAGPSLEASRGAMPKNCGIEPAASSQEAALARWTSARASGVGS